jgi:peptidoglycan hydrolase CwlO-like protein
MIEAFKEEMNTPLKEIQGKTIKPVNEMNETIQDLKMEIEAMKENINCWNPRDENLGKRTGSTDASITNRIHEL